MYTSKSFRQPAILWFAAIAIMLISGACIKNDLPYPWVQPVFTRFDVADTDNDGNQLLSAPTEIDSAARTITVHLSEWADIRSVSLNEYTLSEGTIMVSPQSLPSTLDLSNPISVTLSLYERSFDWTIEATQDIRRYFIIGSQIGSAEIDAIAHTVKAYVPAGQPLDAIKVISLKLAGEGAVMTPDLNGQTVDFTSPVTVAVEEFGQTVDWTVTVETTEVSVMLERIDAWTKVAWLYASAESGKQNSFEYRKASQQDWIVVPTEWITVNGGNLTACLRNLEPQTEYVARAISGDDYSAELSFTTGEVIQLPNSDFTQWWLNNKVWNPWAADGESFWDTGNRGAATLGTSNSLPLDNPASPTGYQGVVLKTEWKVVKLAAGSIFAGSYVRTDGTNGVLSFGRPFTARPTALKARIKYTSTPITKVGSTSNPNLSYMKDKPDTCIVWCALADFEEPFELRTKPSDRQLFSPEMPGVIAYGEFTSGESIEDYTDVIIRFNYNATDRIPRYILLTASASKYGDFFTGGPGSTLTVLSYELLYDY